MPLDLKTLLICCRGGEFGSKPDQVSNTHIELPVLPNLFGLRDRMLREERGWNFGKGPTLDPLFEDDDPKLLAFSFFAVADVRGEVRVEESFLVFGLPGATHGDEVSEYEVRLKQWDVGRGRRVTSLSGTLRRALFIVVSASEPNLPNPDGPPPGHFPSDPTSPIPTTVRPTVLRQD